MFTTAKLIKYFHTAKLFAQFFTETEKRIHPIYSQTNPFFLYVIYGHTSQNVYLYPGGAR